MDEERPIDQFIGFLKLVGTLFVIILTGLALVLGLLWYLSPEPAEDIERLNNPTVRRLPAYEPDAPAPTETAGPIAAELAAAEAEYREARAELEAVLDTSNGAPAVIEEDIGVVEQAIVEIVSALALNPENQFLQKTLLGNYQRQVELLRKSVEIAQDPAPPEHTQ